MKVKILSSTNPKIKKYVGETRNYFKMYGFACLEDLNKPGYGIQTSKIIEEEKEGNILKIKTKNSIYELEVLEVSNERKKKGAIAIR